MCVVCIYLPNINWYNVIYIYYIDVVRDVQVTVVNNTSSSTLTRFKKRRKPPSSIWIKEPPSSIGSETVSFQANGTESSKPTLAGGRYTIEKNGQDPVNVNLWSEISALGNLSGTTSKTHGNYQISCSPNPLGSPPTYTITIDDVATS